MHPHSLLLPFTPNSPWVLMQPQLASNACAPRLGTTVRGGLDSSRGGHSRQVATWHVKRDSDYCPKDHRLIQYRRSGILWPPRVSARKKFMGGGQLENTNLLKKGICLLNTFLKDFTKIPIKKTLFCSLMGGISPLAKIMRGINPPVPPSPPLYETLPPLFSYSFKIK